MEQIPNQPIVTKVLEDMPLEKISAFFSKANKENRVTIVPIGFPGAGKSLFLSSLFRYARNGHDPLFSIALEDRDYYRSGRSVIDQMIANFDAGKLYQTTRRGTLDLIGLTMIPTHPNLHPLKLGFIDLAGDDIKNIKFANKGDFTKKINAVFAGLKADDSPVIFVLITPFVPTVIDDDLADPHREEDTLLFDFLNYLTQTQQDLYDNAKLMIIVSQWDKNRNPSETIESYMRKNRPGTYRMVRNKSVIWGRYSIGKLLETQDDAGRRYQEIVNIDNENPKKLWRNIYRLCTGQDLEKKTFWQKLFS